jgi:hypothetical protein
MSPSFMLDFVKQVNRLGNTRDNRSSNNLAYQNPPEGEPLRTLTAKRADTVRQTAIGLKRTAGSGELTEYEAAVRLNKEKKNYPD